MKKKTNKVRIFWWESNLPDLNKAYNCISWRGRVIMEDLYKQYDVIGLLIGSDFALIVK